MCQLEGSDVGGTYGGRAGTGGHCRCSGFGWLSLAGRTGCLATGTTLRRDGLYASPRKCQRFFVTHLTKNALPACRLTVQFRPPYTLPPVSRERVYGQVAQLVEHATENRGVGGSTPSLAINRVNDLRASDRAPANVRRNFTATAHQNRPSAIQIFSPQSGS